MKGKSKKVVGPGMKIEDGVLTISKPGAVAITENANGDWVYQQGGAVFVIPADQVSGITSIVVRGGTQLDMAAGALAGEVLKITGQGSLNISGVSFTESQNGQGAEASHELKDVDFYDIDATVNGGQADLIKLKWEIYDDLYVTNGYYSSVNEAFVRLGVDYVNYLADGGEPFTDFIAKGSAARSQSMHDNLLGNLNRAAIEDRFSGELEAELLALVPQEYLDRPYFDGNLNKYGGPAHDAVRAFDYDKGWDRPDYIDRNPDGTVDGRASQDRNGDGVDEQMFYGTGNPNTDWNVVRHEGAGVELAIRIKEFNGPAVPDGAPEADGTVRYSVSTGASPFNANRADWSFDYAATVLPSGDDDQFIFKVFYDIDPTEGETLVDASGLLTQYGDAFTDQNSSNYGFGFIREAIDADPDTAGDQAYTFGDGTFTILLQAFKADGETLVAQNRVIVEVGDGDPGMPDAPAALSLDPDYLLL